MARKITEAEKLAYLKRKYMNTCSELVPRNIEIELEDDMEFTFVNIMGRECITIKRKENVN